MKQCEVGCMRCTSARVQSTALSLGRSSSASMSNSRACNINEVGGGELHKNV